MNTSGEANQQQLGTLYWTERQISNPIRWGMLVSGFALISYWEWQGISPTGGIALVAYALPNLAFTLLFARDSLSLRTTKLLVLLSYGFDFLFVAFLIFGLGGTGSQVAFLMYVTLIFKAGLYSPMFKRILLVPPLAIGAYLALLAFSEGPGILSAYSMRPRLFLLLAVPAVTIYAARLLEQREKALFKLNAELQAKTLELRRQTNELRAVFQWMRDGLLVVDHGLRVVALNPVASRILRLEPYAQTPFSLEAADNGHIVTEIVRDAIDNLEGTSKREIQLPQSKEGDVDPRHYQAVGSCIPSENGNGARVVVILRDVTEERTLENAKTSFLSVISHELRTPLSTIKGFIKIILAGRAGPLTEVQADFLNTINGQAEYLHSMINDLVEFSRIQVRRTELDLTSVSLYEVGRTVCARMMPLADDKHLVVVNLVPPDLPPVEGDQIRLEQVVCNLLANAIKFTPDGGTVTLSARDEGCQVSFSVADTGVGIPPNEHEKVFELFHQVSDGPARLYGGMGVGLAICSHIVVRHGGRLSVESEVGKGSVFQFVLPKAHPLGVESRQEAVRLS